MRITRNRADASPRPAGWTRRRSARLNLTEPRQTNLIAPSPPDQIGTTPKIRPKPKNPPKLITAAHAPLLPPQSGGIGSPLPPQSGGRCHEVTEGASPARSRPMPYVDPRWKRAHEPES